MLKVWLFFDKWYNKYDMSIFGKGQFNSSFEKTGDLVYLFAKNKIKMNSSLTVGPNQIAYVMVNDRVTDEFLPGSYMLSVAGLPISTRALRLQKKMNNAKTVIRSIPADLYLVNKETVKFDDIKSFNFVIKDKQFKRVETSLNFSCELKVAVPLDFLETLRKFVAVIGKGVSQKLLKELAMDSVANIAQKQNIQIKSFMTDKEKTEELIFDKFVEKMQKIGIEVISFSMNKLNIKEKMMAAFGPSIDFSQFEKEKPEAKPDGSEGQIVLERVGMQGEGDRKVEATLIGNNETKNINEFLNIEQTPDRPKREFRINLGENSFLTSSGIENVNTDLKMQTIDDRRDNIFERRRSENLSAENVSPRENIFGERRERENIFARQDEMPAKENVFVKPTCKNCGKVLELGDEFCSRCGTKVEKQENK